jgi:hypothetical protein
VRRGPGVGLTAGLPEQWATACLLLADGLDSFRALARGLPVPRARLRPGMLALIDQDADGPAYALTRDDAIRLALHRRVTA